MLIYVKPKMITWKKSIRYLLAIEIRTVRCHLAALGVWNSTPARSRLAVLLATRNERDFFASDVPSQERCCRYSGIFFRRHDLTMIKLIRPRLITFDVTGTLLMTKLEEHYVEVGSQHGLSVDPRRLARSFKNNLHKLSAEHPVFGKHTGMGWENWWRQIVHNVFRDQHNFVADATLDKVIIIIANIFFKKDVTNILYYRL